MPKQLQETGRITEAAVASAKETGRLPVQLISPGWGSSGYYAAEVLEAAVELFPAGTHMYADHPTAEEAKARPVRSIKDLMSVTSEPARIATEEDVTSWGADPGALVADVDILPAYRDVVEHLKDAIGVSIRGDGEITEGTAEGRTGRIVESLAHVASVDWVTRAGRGGRVLSLVESAQANARAIEHGIDEATVNDTREALQTLLRDAHGGTTDDDRTIWVYVRDFEETDEGNTVWFEIENGDDAGTYGQPYTTDDGVVALTGTRTPVRVVTNYVPTTRSDSTTTTESQKEIPMGKIQVEESEHTRLTEQAGRVDALQEENATLKAERDQLREEKATATRTTRAGQIVEARAKEAGVSYSHLEVRGLCAELPVKEDGALDEVAFTTTVDEDAAKRKADGGAGQVIGMGGGSPSGGSTPGWGQIDEALGLEKKGA